MALTPISLFQPQGSGIAQFLQGGQSALASALNNVIQVGRDTANNQFAQERDFLGERQRVEALAQRRGEMAQQQSNLDRTFARGVFESDRQFADVNADQARQEARQRVMDMFSMEESNREFGLRREAADLAMQQRQREEQLSRDILAQPPAAGTAPSRLSPESLFSPVAPAAPGSPLPAPMTGTVPEAAAPAAAGSIEERLAQAEIRAQAAQRVGDAAEFTAATGEAARLRGELRRSGVSTEGMTPTEARSQTRFDIFMQDRASKQREDAAKKAEETAAKGKNEAITEIDRIVGTNFKAFPLASSYLPAEGASPPKGMTKEQLAAARAEATALDADRVRVEIQGALRSPTVEDYLGKAFDTNLASGGRWSSMSNEEKRALAVQKLGEAEVKERERVWNLAEKTGLGKREGAGTTAAPSTAPSTAPAPAPVAPAGNDWLNSNIQDLKK